MNELDYFGFQYVRPPADKAEAIIGDWINHHISFSILASMHNIDQVTISCLIDEYRGDRNIKRPVTILLKSGV